MLLPSNVLPRSLETTEASQKGIATRKMARCAPYFAICWGVRLSFADDSLVTPVAKPCRRMWWIAWELSSRLTNICVDEFLRNVLPGKISFAAMSLGPRDRFPSLCSVQDISDTRSETSYRWCKFGTVPVAFAHWNKQKGSKISWIGLAQQLLCSRL